MPTVDIPDKICPHCGGTKWYTHDGRFWCSTSRKASRQVSYKKENRTLQNSRRRQTPSYERQLLQAKEKRRVYRELNPIVKKKPLSTAERSAKHYTRRKHDETYKKQAIVRAKKCKLKQIESLADTYVKGLIIARSNLSKADIPPDLVILKRKQLELSRQLRQAS